jgi:hypothetical protein
MLGNEIVGFFTPIKANTFSRIFSINLRISCHNLLAALQRVDAPKPLGDTIEEKEVYSGGRMDLLGSFEPHRLRALSQWPDQPADVSDSSN